MNKIERFINTLRETHDDFEYLYLNGLCYRLFLLLRIVFPEAEPYYSAIEGHVYIKIGDDFYDIRGRHVMLPKDICKLNYHDVRKPHRWHNDQNLKERNYGEERQHSISNFNS